MRRDDSAEEPFFQATGAICNLSVLTEAANVSGFLNAAPDPDGLLRRAPLLIERDGQVYPSLALTAFTSVFGTRNVSLRVANVNASSLLLGQPDRAARRQEQPPAPLSRSQAHVPLRLGRRRAARPAEAGHASRTRLSSSGRRPSARARSCRRRSIRSLPASRSRRRSPTTCCSRTSSSGPSTPACSRRSWSSGSGSSLPCSSGGSVSPGARRASSPASPRSGSVPSG